MLKVVQFGKAWIKNLGIVFGILACIALVVGAIAGTILLAASLGGEAAGFVVFLAMLIMAMTAMAAWDSVE